MSDWIKNLLGRKSGGTKRSGGSRRSTRPISPGQSNPSKYRAVVIYSRSECCEAASRLEGRKFLAAHAPQLPLGGCSQPEQCQCRYKHLPDRRQELRRDTDHGLPSRNYIEGERRMRKDRRRDHNNPLSA